jgi:hypothetical protein
MAILIEALLLFRKHTVSIGSEVYVSGSEFALPGVIVPRYLLRIHQFAPSDTSVSVWRIFWILNSKGPSTLSISLS